MVGAEGTESEVRGRSTNLKRQGVKFYKHIIIIGGEKKTSGGCGEKGQKKLL